MYNQWERTGRKLSWLILRKDYGRGETCSMHDLRNTYKILVGYPGGNRSLGRPKTRYEDNNKMNFKYVMNLWTLFSWLSVGCSDLPA
jgi:hypothetical protein